ncbi:hypothetical protein MKZ02_08485 [Pseudobacillus sp. FSL P4-0506]|uniref:hypothetical protein n=1 Tax=unclassified Pseudobacillus TaxID=2619284 RepID=UPI0030FC73A3
MTNKLLAELAQSISQLESEAKGFLEEINTSITSEKSKLPDKVSCFFTHSFLLNKDLKDNQIMIGSFSVKNNSRHVITSPIVLIKVKSDQAIDFSGKFTRAKQMEKHQKFGWERIEREEEEDGETSYWLKPIYTDKILPGEVLAFKNFQIGFSLLKPNNILIEGFVYCAEQTSGVSSLNTININC